MPDAEVQNCVDEITTELLRVWYRNVPREAHNVTHLTATLPALAYARGLCVGSPLAGWLHERLLPSEPPEVRKATATALGWMVPAAPDLGELLPLVITGLRDANWVVRAQCAGQAALLGPAAGSPELVSALVRLLEESASRTGYLPEHLREGPRGSEPGAGWFNDLRDNDPQGYARAAAAVALSAVMGVQQPEAAAALWPVLGDRAWCVGAIAAELLLPRFAAKVTERLMLDLRSGDRARFKWALGCAGRLGAGAAPELVDALVEVALRGPLGDRAAGLEALAELGRHACRRPEVGEQLEAARKLTGWPLSAFFQRAAERRDRAINPGELSAFLLQTLRADEPERPGMAARPAVEGAVPTGIVHVLHVGNASADQSLLRSELQADFVRKVTTALRGTEAFGAANRSPDLVPYVDGVAVLFYDHGHQPIDCAVAATTACRPQPLLRLRFGIASGEISLEKDGEGEWRADGKALRAAWVLSGAGDPGQILVAGTTVAGLPEDRPGVFLTDWGECHIEGHAHQHVFNFYDPCGEFGNPDCPARVLPPEPVPSEFWPRFRRVAWRTAVTGALVAVIGYFGSQALPYVLSGFDHPPTETAEGAEVLHPGPPIDKSTLRPATGGANAPANPGSGSAGAPANGPEHDPKAAPDEATSLAALGATIRLQVVCENDSLPRVAYAVPAEDETSSTRPGTIQLFLGETPVNPEELRLEYFDALGSHPVGVEPTPIPGSGHGVEWEVDLAGPRVAVKILLPDAHGMEQQLKAMAFQVPPPVGGR